MKIPAMIAAELRRLTSTGMGSLALFALLCVPILYGGLYLWANQDPNAKFREMPVALVVLDKGAADTAADASGTVNYGDKVADNLVDGHAFDWKRMTEAEAKKAIRLGQVDFTVLIPENFSADLASAAGNNPVQAVIQLETNDANNYLATTIGNQAAEKIRASVAQMVGEQAADRMLTAISTIRGSLVTAVDGANKLVNGANTASSGSVTLADGTAKLVSGSSELVSGTDRLASGAEQVSAGNQELARLADQAASASQRAMNALPQVRNDIQQVLLTRGFTQQEVDEILTKLGPVDQRLREGNSSLQSAVRKVDELASGAAQVASGASQLRDGVTALSNGINEANSGAGQLRDGLSQIASGTGELRDGLQNGVGQIPESTPELRTTQASTIANPVKISADSIASAQDYGAGLAPFFAALASWIGIYALFLIVKPISRRAITALHSPVRITIATWLVPAMLGAVQMVGLMTVLMFALKFEFYNALGTLGILMFASACFAAIILALNIWFGSVGEFLGLVLMVLQLVTAGGTYPWQTLPAPLAALHHMLPMSYVVDAIRQLMYGGDAARAAWDLTFIGMWGAVALLLSIIGITRMTHHRTLRDLEPSLIG